MANSVVSENIIFWKHNENKEIKNSLEFTRKKLKKREQIWKEPIVVDSSSTKVLWCQALQCVSHTATLSSLHNVLEEHPGLITILTILWRDNICLPKCAYMVILRSIPRLCEGENQTDEKNLTSRGQGYSRWREKVQSAGASWTWEQGATGHQAACTAVVRFHP